MGLSEKDEQILAQIASDIESGRHLLRTEEGWKAIGIDKVEYNKMFYDLIYANVYFDWASSDWDETIERQAMMLLFVKSHMNYEFNELLKSLCQEISTSKS